MATGAELDQSTSSAGWSRARICHLVALGLVLAAGAVILFVPLMAEETSTGSPSGAVIEQEQSRLSDDMGTGGVLAIIAVPLILTLLPFVTVGATYRVTTWVTAMIFLALCVLTGFTVGLFFLPAALALLVTAILASAKRPKPG